MREQSIDALAAALATGHGRDVDVQDDHGWSPLMNAAAVDDEILGPQLVALLLDHSASVNLRDRSGYALHWAVAVDSTRAMRITPPAQPLMTARGDREKLRCTAPVGSVGLKRSKFSWSWGGPGSDDNALELPIDLVGQLPGVEADFDDKKAIRALLLEKDPSRRLLVLHHPDCLDHVTAPGHQEAPGRISAIMDSLDGHFDARDLRVTSDFPLASLDAVQKVHSQEYVECVVQLSKQVGESGNSVPFTPRVQTSVRKIPLERVKSDSGCDTTFSQGSLNAALRAAGITTLHHPSSLRLVYH